MTIRWGSDAIFFLSSVTNISPPGKKKGCKSKPTRNSRGPTLGEEMLTYRRKFPSVCSNQNPQVQQILTSLPNWYKNMVSYRYQFPTVYSHPKISKFNKISLSLGKNRKKEQYGHGFSDPNLAMQSASPAMGLLNGKWGIHPSKIQSWVFLVSHS